MLIFLNFSSKSDSSGLCPSPSILLISLWTELVSAKRWRVVSRNLKFLKLQIQVKEQTSSSEWCLGCPSEMRSSVILVWLRVEQTLLYIKMNQLRWLRDITPESLLDQVFQARPTWRRPWGRPRKPQRDYVSCLAGLGMSLCPLSLPIHPCAPDPDPNKYHDISVFQRMLYQMQQRSERVVAWLFIVACAAIMLKSSAKHFNFSTVVQ